MSIYTTRDIRKGRMLLGSTPLPKGAVLLGTVCRGHGAFDKGALVKMPRGQYVQLLYGTMRALPQMMVDRSLFSLRDGETEYRKHIPMPVAPELYQPDAELTR